MRLTLGRTVSAVRPELAPGGALAGFRYATVIESERLQANAGPLDTAATLRAFMELLGLDPATPSLAVLGFFLAGDTQCVERATVLLVDADGPLPAITQCRTSSADPAIAGAGSLLVRETPSAIDGRRRITVTSNAGHRIPPDNIDLRTTGLQFLDVRPLPIRFGTGFDALGDVVNGDALLVAVVALGSAPVAEAAIRGGTDEEILTVKRASPRRCRALPSYNNGVTTLPDDLPAITVRLPAATGLPSGEGEMLIGVVLLERIDQPLAKAFGVVVPYRVQIGAPHTTLGSITRSMTRGGAAILGTLNGCAL